MVQVTNCYDCPFVITDRAYGLIGCAASNAVSNDLERISRDIYRNTDNLRDTVHGLCPLRNADIVVSLKPE